ncbi:MAG: hypothetical protein AAF830_14365 [Pseudomonadota bacterium]
MVTQDDLLLLNHLRAHACGGKCFDQSRQALSQEPGRAAGRVLSWSLGRVAAHVKRFGRKGWRCGKGMVPTGQETRVLGMVRALAAFDQPAAEAAALWLVPRGEVATLLERAMPLTAFYTADDAARRAATA